MLKKCSRLNKHPTNIASKFKEESTKHSRVSNIPVKWLNAINMGVEAVGIKQKTEDITMVYNVISQKKEK
jgi:hypothetical protein